MKCPSCRLPLVRTPDLFGEPRYRHPNDKCEGLNVPQVERVCIQCQEPFMAKRTQARAYRKTCSEDCRRVWQILHARQLAKTRTPRPRTVPNVFEHKRSFWQRRAEEQDRRWQTQKSEAA